MMTSLDDWLSKITKESVPGIQLGLGRCRKLINGLGCFSGDQRSVVVGGTNGKGSCVAMLEAILLEYGYTVGSYTSPHIHKINERIKRNGIEITDQQLIQSFEIIGEAQGSDNLTFFEYVTMAAFYFFSQYDLDIIILEVGLGGRLDAVNCIDSDIALISSVSIDHVEFLGDTREKIGFEKAGIMRKGKHAVCSDNNIPDSIIKFALENEVFLHTLGVDFQINHSDSKWQWWTDDKMVEGLYNSLIRTNSQLRNLSGVLKVLDLLELELKEKKIQKALDSINLKGRFEIFKYNNKEWIIDVAHNREAATNLADCVNTLPKYETTLGIFGLQKTKNLPDFFEAFVEQIDLWFLPSFNQETFWRTSDIKCFLENSGVEESHIFSFDSMGDAVNEIKSRLSCDRILVAGSFVLVQQVLENIDTSI